MQAHFHVRRIRVNSIESTEIEKESTVQQDKVYNFYLDDIWAKQIQSWSWQQHKEKETNLVVKFRRNDHKKLSPCAQKAMREVGKNSHPPAPTIVIERGLLD